MAQVDHRRVQTGAWPVDPPELALLSQRSGFSPVECWVGLTVALLSRSLGQSILAVGLVRQGVVVSGLVQLEPTISWSEALREVVLASRRWEPGGAGRAPDLVIGPAGTDWDSLNDVAPLALGLGPVGPDGVALSWAHGVEVPGGWLTAFRGCLDDLAGRVAADPDRSLAAVAGPLHWVQAAAGSDPAPASGDPIDPSGPVPAPGGPTDPSDSSAPLTDSSALPGAIPGAALDSAQPDLVPPSPRPSADPVAETSATDADPDADTASEPPPADPEPPPTDSAAVEAVVRPVGRGGVDLTALSDPSQTVVSAFRRQALAQPDRTALFDADGARVSYGQLDLGARRLAQALVRRSVHPGDLVGLLARRGADFYCGLLGILYAGAAYVPIDPAGTIQEIADQLGSAQAKAVLIEGWEQVRSIPELPLVCLEDPALAELPAPPPPALAPTDLACGLFGYGLAEAAPVPDDVTGSDDSTGPDGVTCPSDFSSSIDDDDVGSAAPPTAVDASSNGDGALSDGSDAAPVPDDPAPDPPESGAVRSGLGLIDHASLVGLAVDLIVQFDLGPGQVVLAEAAPTQDTHLGEWCPALLCGAALRILPDPAPGPSGSGPGPEATGSASAASELATVGSTPAGLDPTAAATAGGPSDPSDPSAELLRRSADDPALAERVAWWRDQVERVRAGDLGLPWPADGEPIDQVVVELDRERTRRLLRESAQAYHSEVFELVLAAVAAGLGEVFGRTQVALEIDAPGGSATTYPILVRVGPVISQAIVSAKEARRATPDGGSTYSRLAARPDLGLDRFRPGLRLRCPDGLTGAPTAGGQSAEAALAPTGDGPDQPRHPLALTVTTVSDRLVLRLDYHPASLDPVTAQRLGLALLDAAHDVVEHCGALSVPLSTPADVGAPGLDDATIAWLNAIADDPRNLA
ncbi:MAG: AMP-binding protein [Propionibacteriaceae bacterium]|jgi:hypothetical protein|nr:AMP-binding protein [Propionibacteriaceae bacterium]